MAGFGAAIGMAAAQAGLQQGNNQVSNLFNHIYQLGWWNRQNRWDEDIYNKYNSPAAQARQYAEAGYNPALLTPGSSSMSTSSNTSQPSGQRADFDLQGAISSQLAIRQQDNLNQQQENNNIVAQSQVAKNQAQTDLINQQKTNLAWKFENEFQYNLRILREQAGAATLKKQQMLNKIILFNLEKQLLDSQVKLFQQKVDNLSITNKYLPSYLNFRNNKVSADADYRRQEADLFSKYGINGNAPWYSKGIATLGNNLIDYFSADSNSKFWKYFKQIFK